MSESQLGVGVMLNYLGGNAETVAAIRGAVGKTIRQVVLRDDELRFTFYGGSKLTLYDDEQICCESRYMRTDDDLKAFSGAKFLGIEVKQAPDVFDEWITHEVQFLEIQTDRGVFTMSSHNEHNGYYGGFSIVASSK